MNYTVYILRTSSNTLYTGQTKNLEDRLKKHTKGTGAKYVKYFSSFKLVYSEQFETRSEAMKREAQVKNFSKAKKEELIKTNITI